jgi:uncharacterized membrane protein YkoI
MCSAMAHDTGRFNMTRKRTAALLVTGGLLAVGLVAGARIATGSTDDDATERAITGSALDRASQVALAHLGEGRVTDTEVRDEESYYEVEVTLDDGRQVDVQLDEEFNVVGEAVDQETDQ